MYYQNVAEYIDVSKGHEGKLERWLSDVNLGPGTDPRRALSFASQMNPDAVFLLSDGRFNQPPITQSETGWIDADGVRSQISVLEGVPLFYRSTPIHTIAFENPFSSDAMKRIADITNGIFRYVRTNSHQPLEAKRFASAMRAIERKHRNDKTRRQEVKGRLIG